MRLVDMTASELATVYLVAACWLSHIGDGVQAHWAIEIACRHGAIALSKPCLWRFSTAYGPA